MKRMATFLLLILALLASACQASAPALEPVSSPTPAPGYSIILHPDGALYVGDLVSIEVISPTGVNVANTTVRVSAGDKTLAESGFSSYGIAGRNQATFYWIWDTTSLQAGSHTLNLELLPGGAPLHSTLNLLPASERPVSHWKVASSECCTINYITGTEAERDIEELKKLADGIAAELNQKLNFTLAEKIPVIFMSRTLGHGGFTREAIYVSYLDRNYAGSTTAQVLEHEMTHWYDAQKGGNLRPTLFVEGLAVYLSGGHFKPEALMPRAAALLDMGWYLPLIPLSDNFYPSQHEIGYLEAGALVQYMTETYGWDAFETFFRDIAPTPGGSQSEAIDIALQKHFQISFETLEQNFKSVLAQHLTVEDTRSDLRLSVNFYETVRRYQRMFDPSAYFQTAWLPDASQMRQSGITADYQRHPDGIVNHYLENMLVTADSALRSGNFIKTEQDLSALNVMLDILQNAR